MDRETKNVPRTAKAQGKIQAAARRAMREAEARRREMDSRPAPAREVNGRKGPDPTRYGDWEKNGIACDF